MNRIYQKLKSWYRGENTPIALNQIFEALRQNQKYLENKKLNIPDMLKPPLIACIITSLWLFWSRNWKWLLGFMSTLIGLFIGYLKL